MYNVYSPTMQQITGVPPGSLPTRVDFSYNMNPPVPNGPEDFNPAIQTANPQAYNYGPQIGQPMPYDQMRQAAAQNLQQQLSSPIVQVSGYGGAPQYQYNPQWGYPQPQQMQSVQIIEGFNPLGTPGISAPDYDQRKQEMESYYRKAIQKDMDDRYKEFQNSYNYYGYYNTNYVDQNIANGYQNAKRDLENEAKANRIELNKRLSSLAHSYIGDIDPKEVEKIYEDRRVVTNYGYTFSEIQEADRFSKMVPVDDQIKAAIRKANADASAKHNAYVKPDSNLFEFLENAGMPEWEKWNQQAILSQRNKDRFSDEDFRQFMSTQLKRRDPNGDEAFDALLNTFSDAREMAGLPAGMTIPDDNTVKIQYPSPMAARTDIGFTNEQQSKYEKQRSNFMNTIYNGGGGMV